jgi:hypothetical protein
MSEESDGPNKYDVDDPFIDDNESDTEVSGSGSAEEEWRPRCVAPVFSWNIFF